MALSKSTDDSLPTLFLPDVLAHWPWPRRINPFYEEVSAASADWLRSFHAFSPAAQRAFDKCQFGLLASLAYPNAKKKHLRIGCDLMNLFFVIDEHTDVVDNPDDARAMVAVVLDALHHPDVPRPLSSGEWIGAEVARQFWARARTSMVPVAQTYFLDTFSRYLDAVVVEAADRAVADGTKETNHTVESYLALRSQTIGLMPSLAVNLAGLGALTAEDLRDPAVVELVALGTTLIGLGNDLVSYAKERSEAAATHNVVTVVLRSRRHVVAGGPSPVPDSLADEQAAITWVAQYHEKLERTFLDQHKAFCAARRRASATSASSSSALATQQILTYIGGIGQWIRSNDQWSFETERYFGTQGADVQRSRHVVLRPVQKKATPLSEALLEGEASGGEGACQEGAWPQGKSEISGVPVTPQLVRGSPDLDPLLCSHGWAVPTATVFLLVAIMCLLMREMVFMVARMQKYYEM